MAEKRDEDEEFELEAVRLADVSPAKVRHLVEPYLPVGAIALLEGDPAAGKSYVAASFGAALTSGREPDLAIRQPVALERARSVLYLTAEDSPEVLRERFAAQGADLERVFCVGKTVSVRKLGPLERLLERHRPGLVVIDPVHALLDGVNMNTANTVRVALAPLAHLASQHDFALLGVRHLAKAGRGRAIYRGIGSIDFSAVARSVLRIGEDPQRPGSRALVHVKNTFGPLGPSIEFEIGERLTWLGKSELTSQDLDARPTRSRGRSAVEIAEEFLRGQLANGPKLAHDIRSAAAQTGIAERTLERAQKSLGVLHERLNQGERRGRGHWVWYLPSAEADRVEARRADD